MFGSVNKHVKTTYTQHDATNHDSSLSRKQQFVCRWTLSPLVDVICDIPASRSKHAVCLYDNYVYLYGGRYGSIGCRDLWRYNIAQTRWEVLHGTGDHPSLLQSHTLLAYEGQLYVFGGNFCVDPETPLWIFHLGSLQWHKHAAPSEVVSPCSRRGHTAVLFHDAMHIYGGYVDLKGSNNELWTFDFATGGWHLAYTGDGGKSGPGARHGHSAVVYDGSMWVFGGMTNLEAKSDFWCWNFEAHLWKRVKGQRGVPELSGHSACVVADSMLVFGGSSHGELENAVWRFHFGTQSWQRMVCEGAAPSPCHYHSVVVIQHQVSPPADRCHSAPHVSHCALLEPQIEQPRPKSSPASIPTPHGRVPFQNQVQPYYETPALPSSRDKCEFEMFDIRHMRTEHPPRDATRVSCPLCAATGTLYQLRKSWSIDFSFGARTGIHVRKVSEARPLVHRGKHTFNENISLSSFGGSENPVYDDSPPYTSIEQFQHRMTDHEEIPLKKLRPNNAAPLFMNCEVQNNSTSQRLGSTPLCLGCNKSKPGRAKLRNHSKSSSLESLLSRFDGAEIEGSSSHVSCCSVVENDLFIEDIEETSFSCNDDATNEVNESLTTSAPARQVQDVGHVNCAAVNTCNVSDAGKPLIIVTNSANCTIHHVNVDSTTSVVSGSDLKHLDTESGWHSRMAWMQPGSEDGKENLGANCSGHGEKKKGVGVKVTEPVSDSCHVSTISHEQKPMQWQMSASGTIYEMIVFGGRVDESQNLPVQPLSVSKLYISTVHL